MGNKVKELILPNFMIVGPGRSGTTFLYYNLIEHPNIFLKYSKTPEPHFFVRDIEYEKGLEYYSNKYFSSWNGEKAIGEASTSTFYSEKAPKRLQKHILDIKLICMLRNPVERMFSDYWYSVDNGWEELSYEEAIAQEEKRINNPKNEYYRDFEPGAYAKRGFYYNFLKMWLKHFPKKQFKVCLFDDLINQPERLIKSVYSFLQVDDSFVPSLPEEGLNKSSHSERQMSSKTRKYHINLYRYENNKLAKLIGRNLDSWNIL